MRIAAIVVASIALMLALPLVGIVFFVFGSTLFDSGLMGMSLTFLVLAACHLAFTAGALLLGTREKLGFSIASLLMSGVSILATLCSFLIGPALLFGLSGA
jgi:hypothetical protein